MIDAYPEPHDRFEHTKYIVWVRHLGGTNLHADLSNVTYAEAYAHWRRRRTQVGDCYILAVTIDPEDHHKRMLKSAKL